MMGVNSLNDKSFKKTIIIYSLTFVVLLFLCWLFPYTGDDWAWGSSIGLERLSNWFAGYSGRYLGNLIVLLLTRSRILRTVVMSGVITGILVILNELTGRNRIGFWLAAVELSLMPVLLLRQAIVWTSGFSNYSTSIFLTLIYIFEIKNIFTDCPEKSKVKIVPLAILGFCNALIVEHLTIYNLLLGLFVIGFVLVKYRTVRLRHIAYLLGCIFGACLMFSNSVYTSIANNKDDYRTFALTGILEKFNENYTKSIMTNGFADNWLLLTAISFACLLLLIHHCKRASAVRMVLSFVLYIPVLIYNILSISYNLYMLSGIEELSELFQKVIVVSTAIYVFFLLMFIISLELDKAVKLKLIFILISAYVMILPLFIVTPIGSRCFFAPYVMMMWFTLEIINSLDDDFIYSLNKCVCPIVFIVFCSTAMLFYVYSEVHTAELSRAEKAIADSKQSDLIEVADLPYTAYVWSDELNRDIWKERFKLFYGIDENIKIKRFIDN